MVNKRIEQWVTTREVAETTGVDLRKIEAMAGKALVEWWDGGTAVPFDVAKNIAETVNAELEESRRRYMQSLIARDDAITNPKPRPARRRLARILAGATLTEVPGEGE